MSISTPYSVRVSASNEGSACTFDGGFQCAHCPSLINVDRNAVSWPVMVPKKRLMALANDSSATDDKPESGGLIGESVAREVSN